MKKRLFLKALIGLSLLPIISASQIVFGVDKVTQNKIKLEFIESDGWIVKPDDIKPLQANIEPTSSVLQNVKYTYHNLKYRYKAAKKSFMEPH